MENFSLFKCKNCGAELNLRNALGGVVECGYCHTPWTVPKQETAPEALKYLHDGNAALDVCKFEDAYTYFQKAAEFDKNEPEAYFGMALASFKVQYLKDEVNNRLQPICHEVTEQKFTESMDYLRAFRYATREQQAEYEKKGEEIDYILGEFFRLKQAGINYDCFICTKVTDEETKQSTEDSKDADYIYRLLQDKGYKPFYSERELRNVTGADYEARILYALFESECMLVVCRKEEYLKTPWVKNEYTRFLKLVNDEEKESDSVAIVFHGTPIEKLPGRNGKLQGIDFALRESDGKIVDFVEAHTPEAKKRREEEEESKKAEEEARKHAFEEQQRALEERWHAFEEQQKQFTEQQRQQAQIFEEQKKELERMQTQNGGGGTNLSGAALLGAIKQAQEEEQRKREEEQRKREEEQRKREEEQRKREEEQRRREEERKQQEEEERRRKLAPFEIMNGTLVKYSGHDSNVTIPDDEGVFQIGMSAFSHCTTLQKVRIPKGVFWILDFAFWSCTGLIEISIPDSVTSIGKWAFRDCSSLTEIKIPEGVTEIGSDAFAGCTSLKEIKIPEGVTEIGHRAFFMCGAFNESRAQTELVIPNSVTTIGNYAFVGCPLKNVTIPKRFKGFLNSGLGKIFGDRWKQINFTFT